MYSCQNLFFLCPKSGEAVSQSRQAFSGSSEAVSKLNCVSFVCEFKGSSRAPGGRNNGVHHSNDVLQARANVKNNKYKDVYGLTRRLHLPL